MIIIKMVIMIIDVKIKISLKSYFRTHTGRKSLSLGSKADPSNFPQSSLRCDVYCNNIGSRGDQRDADEVPKDSEYRCINSPLGFAWHRCTSRRSGIKTRRRNSITEQNNSTYTK